MRINSVIAIILIVVGIVAFAYQGITYTSREKVVDIGPIEISTEKTNTFPLPPVAGGIAFVGGIVLLLAGGKKKGNSGSGIISFLRYRNVYYGTHACDRWRNDHKLTKGGRIV